MATALSSLCGRTPVMPLSAGTSDERQVETACVALVCHGASAAAAVRTGTKMTAVSAMAVPYSWFGSSSPRACAAARV